MPKNENVFVSPMNRNGPSERMAKKRNTTVQKSTLWGVRRTEKRARLARRRGMKPRYTVFSIPPVETWFGAGLV